MTIPRKPQLNQQNLNSEKKGMGITVLSCYNHSRQVVCLPKLGCRFALHQSCLEAVCTEIMFDLKIVLTAWITFL